MILDTSSIMAVTLGESTSRAVRDAVVDAKRIRISASTLVELTAVLTRLPRPEVHRRVESMLAEWDAEVVPFDAEQARVAQQAYRDYGRGSGHPARLNLGDCYSYALAAVTREPLLYVGDDFVHTDIPSALD